MTIEEFLEVSYFCAYEVYFEINFGDTIKYNLTKQELCSYYDEIIKQLEFTVADNSSGESCLIITFYI
jgi:hypothetical protein